jgi:general secretion pathway protein E
LENISPKTFSSDKDVMDTFRRAMLAQPNVIVAPDFVSSRLADRLAHEVNSEKRTVITRTQAGSAAEALLKVYATGEDSAAMIQAMTFVTGQRLIRRLCPACRVPANINPELYQRLGGSKDRPPVVNRQFIPPPPEANLNEKGIPIEIPPCSECHGLGYSGRTLVMETITVDDKLRAVVNKTPTLPAVQEALKKMGHRNLADTAYQMVIAGETSIEEVKRVFHSDKKKA